ncbi:helix-turn-helix domain-containing protein [Streptomyces sp. NPDC090025]|uniref:helix-turn-helix domain-containing protein n=1 Tax=Streptomyces sp. NPDC090025 TaxID=3365922 RepID=UPI00383876ED
MVNRKVLNPETSPQAAFGARLRGQRDARGWSQNTLATRMACSGQHISAVETGRKPPTLPFSRRADQVFETAGAAESFEREWHEMRGGKLLEGFPEYVGYEKQAIELRIFDVGIIPGLLQTPEYTHAVTATEVRRGQVTQQQAERHISLVAERQAAVARQSPLTSVVLDESCIRRRIGGGAVMDAQLQHLIDFAGRHRTMLQVVPFAVEGMLPFTRQIILPTLPDRSVAAYAESPLRGFVERETSAVRTLLMRFLQLQAISLSQADSVALIQEARESL